jgi:hypothetical protein
MVALVGAGIEQVGDARSLSRHGKRRHRAVAVKQRADRRRRPLLRPAGEQYRAAEAERPPGAGSSGRAAGKQGPIWTRPPDGGNSHY